MQELDLNLLVALNALLREKSVTLAAEKMNLSVPAMSRTLSRARKMMGDPLLVRAGMRLALTPVGTDLQPRLSGLLHEAHTIVRSARKIPLRDLEMIFTIRAEEAFLVLADTLHEALERTAPKIQLRIVTRSPHDGDSLREGNVHLEIGEIKDRSPELKLQRLFQSTSTAVARRDHPVFRGRVTAKRFAAYRHVIASRRGVNRSPVDLELERLNLTRTVALIVPSFHAAMLTAATSNLIASIPKVLTRSADLLGLRTFPIPVATSPVTIFQAWHPRFDADPAHRFVRAAVSRACKTILRPDSVQSLEDTRHA